MDTQKSIIQTLENAKRTAGSWRKLAKLIGIPAGTLCRIAKGDYLPRNRRYLQILGVKAPRKVTTGKTIHDMSVKELRFLFEHRLEM
jgi:hypothetical protein